MEVVLCFRIKAKEAIKPHEVTQSIKMNFNETHARRGTISFLRGQKVSFYGPERCLSLRSALRNALPFGEYDPKPPKKQVHGDSSFETVEESLQ